MSLSDYYVYQLRKEGSILPFYIGKGRGNRISRHFLSSSLAKKNHKNSVIKSAIAAGVSIHSEVLYSDLTEEDAFEAEKVLISQYGRKCNNTGTLSNLTPGGEGHSWSEMTRASREAAAKERVEEAYKALDMDSISIDNACIFNGSRGSTMKKQLIAYLRVSTEDQATKGNGLEAQEAAITKFAAENDYEILEVVREDASGKLGLEDRPVLRTALAKALKMKVALVVSKLDRLSRNAAFILNLMNTRAKFIVTQFGENVENFTLHIYAALGEQERKMISERTSAALQSLKAGGKVLGNQTNIEFAREKAAEAIGSKADDFAERMKAPIQRMLAAKMSMRSIAAEFNMNGTKTARGGSWSAATVSNIIARWA